MDGIYSMLSAVDHAIGIDRCADMNTPAGIAALAVALTAGILFGANVAIVFASLTRHEDLAKRIMKYFSYVVWIFRIGGGGGYGSGRRRVPGWH
jgi:hypothetical protein